MCEALPEEMMSWRHPKHQASHTPQRGTGVAEEAMMSLKQSEELMSHWQESMRAQRSGVCSDFRGYLSELTKLLTAHGLKSDTNESGMVPRLAKVAKTHQLLVESVRGLEHSFASGVEFLPSSISTLNAGSDGGATPIKPTKRPSNMEQDNAAAQVRFMGMLLVVVSWEQVLGVASKMLHQLLQNRLTRFEELNRELRSTAVGQVLSNNVRGVWQIGLALI